MKLKWPEKHPRYVIGDKGYDTGKIHLWLKDHKMKDAIAQLRGQIRHHRPKHFPKRIYRKRNVIERCFGRVKEKRAISSRYDKLARNYKSELWLAVIKQYLSILAKEQLVNTA